MDNIVIEPLRSSDVDEASIVLSRAFSSTPLPRAAFGDPSDDQRGILGAAFKMMANMPGKAFVAKENGQIIGAMRIVEWPECRQPPPADVPLPFPEEMAQRFGIWQSSWAQHDPKKPHWHLDPIGVLPERQGQGIGSRLMKHFCEYIDNRKQAAYLETDQPNNVRFYRRFGFTVVEETSVLTVPNWLMWRPPQSA
jgi:ribosomal protein S18 acetylase RimI-like enzyme